MVKLDDRTGNILTTIALFAIVAGIAYATRTTITVFVLALLFAYVLEPAVTWVHLRLTPRASSRNSAIGIVYLVGLTIVAALGLMVAPAITGQLQRLEAALPGMVAKLTDHQFLAGHASQIAAAADRIVNSLGGAAANTGWLLLVPLIAIFFLSHRFALIDGSVYLFAQRRDRARAKATIERNDTVLAQYVRAQLALVCQQPHRGLGPPDHHELRSTDRQWPTRPGSLKIGITPRRPGHLERGSRRGRRSPLLGGHHGCRRQCAGCRDRTSQHQACRHGLLT